MGQSTHAEGQGVDMMHIRNRLQALGGDITPSNQTDETSTQ